MIKLLRVDHRLLHGQVGFVWTNALGVDAILIANDHASTDRFRKTAIRLAKPTGVKLVINSVEDAINVLNSGKTDKYKLMIIVEDVKDAAQIALNCKDVKSINLGGAKHTEESEKLGKAFYITENEKEYLRKLIDNDVEIEVRQLPSDNKTIINEI